MSKIAERLIKLIEDKEYSFGYLSEKTGIPKSAIHRYSTGETSNIPIDRIQKLAYILGVTPEYLLGWEYSFEELIDIAKTIKDVHSYQLFVEKLDKSSAMTTSQRSYLESVANTQMGDLNVNLGPRAVKIPVLGVVPAGIPIEAVENIIDYEEISQEMASSGEFFALQIKGDSMSPRILDGDVVIVRKQENIDSGDIAIVMVNGFDATCKKVLIKENGVMLQPTNPLYEASFYSPKDIGDLPVNIIGKVVELRGKF